MDYSKRNATPIEELMHTDITLRLFDTLTIDLQPEAPISRRANTQIHRGAKFQV